MSAIVNIAAIRDSRLVLGVAPRRGAALPYWEVIKDAHHLDIAVTNRRIDRTFSFMTVDHDGKSRMNPSSPYAMARLLDLQDRYRVFCCQ
jgi:phosphoglucomutase